MSSTECTTVVLKCGSVRKPFAGTAAQIREASNKLASQMGGPGKMARVDTVDKQVYDTYSQYRKNTVW